MREAEVHILECLSKCFRVSASVDGLCIEYHIVIVIVEKMSEEIKDLNRPMEKCHWASQVWIPPHDYGVMGNCHQKTSNYFHMFIIHQEFWPICSSKNIRPLRCNQRGGGLVLNEMV